MRAMGLFLVLWSHTFWKLLRPENFRKYSKEKNEKKTSASAGNNDFHLLRRLYLTRNIRHLQEASILYALHIASLSTLLRARSRPHFTGSPPMGDDSGTPAKRQHVGSTSSMEFNLGNSPPTPMPLFSPQAAALFFSESNFSDS